MKEPIITMSFAEFEELQKEFQEKVPEALKKVLWQHTRRADVQEFLKDFQRLLSFLKLEEVKRVYGDSSKSPRTFIYAIDRVTGEIESILR